MEAELIKTFRFDAAHSLKTLPAGHKCRRIHGHGYRVDVHITGGVDAKTGMVMDFIELAKVVKPIIDMLDHQLLDEVPGLENSTSEVLARYFWSHIKPQLGNLTAITIWESDTSRCIYRGA